MVDPHRTAPGPTTGTPSPQVDLRPAGNADQVPVAPTRGDRAAPVGLTGAAEATPPTGTTPAATGRTRVGQALALTGAGLLLTAVFAPWADPTRAALHTGLLGPQRPQPTVGVVLVALASLAAMTALAGDRGWPRVVAALGAAGTILGHLQGWTTGTMPTGASITLAAVVVLLLAAAVATAAPATQRLGGAPDG